MLNFDQRLFNYVTSSIKSTTITSCNDQLSSSNIYWTESSMSSISTSSNEGLLLAQILNSISLVVALGRFFVNHGGLLN